MGNSASPRVLIVLPSLDAGGAERVAVNLAAGLRAAGSEVRLLLTDHAGPLRDRLPPDVPVDVLGRARVRAALPGLIRHIRAGRPDVVLSTHTHVNLALCAVRRALPSGTRLVLRSPMHAPVELDGRSTRWTRVAQRLLYPRAELVLASSPPMVDDLRSLTRARIELLPSPVDEAALRTAVTTPPDRADPGPGTARRFVMVGRLKRQKGIDDLLRAFASLPGADDRLDVLGEGPERPALERLIGELGLADRVTLPGVLPDPWATIARADAFVLASHHEGLPNVVLESLALGTPVIATTDLEVLVPLSEQAPTGALRLVARSELGAAMDSVRPMASGTVLPRPSMLPPDHAVGAVTARLLELLGAAPSAAPRAGLRILFPILTPFPSSRAPAIQAANMAQAFAELGHTAHVVAPAGDPTSATEDPAGALGFAPMFTTEVLSDRVRRGQSYLHALRIARRARLDTTDLVFSRNLRACLLPALRGVPTVFEAHTLTALDRPQERWVLRRLLASRGFRGVVAISAALAEDLVAHLGLPAERILVAHDAVRPSDVVTPPPPRTAGGALRVGYTGSLHPGKGADLLLEVAATCPWAQFDLAGGPAGLASRLRDEVERAGLTNVTIHGPLAPAQARALQQRCDVLVAPFARRVESDSGVDIARWTSPLKLFEYLASGRPTVSSDLPVLREVIRADVDALLVPPGDVGALTSALERLRDDPALGARLAASASERVSTDFTWELRARRILDRFVVPDPGSANRA